MIDVVTELREQQRVQRQPNGKPTYLSDLPGRAADEIERLRGERLLLRVAVEAARDWLAENGQDRSDIHFEMCAALGVLNTEQ